MNALQGDLYATDTIKRQNQIIQEATRLLYDRMKSRKIGERISCPDHARKFLHMKLAELEHEVFAVIFVNSQHELIKYEEMFRGTIDGAAVYPREVAKAALQCNAAAVFIAHNHPSGCTDPSQADIRITERLQSALGMFDIRVLDHLIVGGAAGEDILSFAEKGLI